MQLFFVQTRELVRFTVCEIWFRALQKQISFWCEKCSILIGPHPKNVLFFLAHDISTLSDATLNEENRSLYIFCLWFSSVTIWRIGSWYSLIFLWNLSLSIDRCIHRPFLLSLLAKSHTISLCTTIVVWNWTFFCSEVIIVIFLLMEIVYYLQCVLSDIFVKM